MEEEIDKKKRTLGNQENNNINQSGGIIQNFLKEIRTEMIETGKMRIIVGGEKVDDSNDRI